jgi:hypothetical protein
VSVEVEEPQLSKGFEHILEVPIATATGEANKKTLAQCFKDKLMTKCNYWEKKLPSEHWRCWIHGKTFIKYLPTRTFHSQELTKRNAYELVNGITLNGRFHVPFQKALMLEGCTDSHLMLLLIGLSGSWLKRRSTETNFQVEHT